MEFPVTGLIILAAAIWFFFFSPRLLYAATIVSIPFSATAVVNFGLAGSQYGTEKSIMAFQLFTVLWLSREALCRLPQWHRRGWRLTRRARIRMLVFLGTVALSLCVPVILNGTSSVESWIASPTYRGPGVIPLGFTFYNLTQSAYLIFGVLITIFVAAKNWHPARLLYTLRLYVGSCAFAAGWGLFQLWCHLTRHIYPAYVFNTGTNMSTLGYMETITIWDFSFGRISSVATEPAVLAQELLLGFAVLIVCLGLRRPILPGAWNWFAIGLVGTVLLMSTSTTAYAGMFAALLLAGLALARAGERRWKYYPAMALVALAAGIFLAREVALVGGLAQTGILHKYQTFSGMARLDSDKLAARAFLRYPILGTGWGTVSSADLVFLILANVGMVGLLAFGAFLLPVFRSLWRSTWNGSFSAAVLLPSVALWVLLVEGGGLSVPIGYNWLFLGLAAGAVAAAELEPCLRTAKLGVTAR